MPLNLSDLNQAQYEAVTAADGPVLVLAGAGSGKTKVLTYRVAYLLAEKKADPENILALTFTNKAAIEMKERIHELVETSPPAWVSTFHSACVRILRREIETLGFTRDFLIYDTREKNKILKDVIKEFNLDIKKFPHQAAAKKVSSIKNNLRDPKELTHPYDQIYQAYQERLYRENALDFDDLIRQCIKLFQQYPHVLEKYQKKFCYLLVDEFQDTNPAQNRLIILLAPPQKNVFVVGDDDQSIYLFRGADVTNILEFEKTFPQTRTIKLEKNYRSTQTVLDAANQVVSNNPGRKPKRLWTDKEQGPPLKCFRAEDDREEAHFVAKEIRDNCQQLPLMAVLYRTNAQSRVLEEALKLQGISYTVVGNKGFFDRKEVKDILAYLMLIQCPYADTQLERVINEPKRGIGKTSLDKIKRYAESKELSLFDAMQKKDCTASLSGKAKQSVNAFVDLIKNFQSMSEYLGIQELIEEVAESTGYIDKLRQENTREAEDRIANIQELYSMGKELEERGGDTLGEFLTHNALLGDIDTWEDEDQAQVVLMTLHSAKGLEFPGVFLTGMEEGLFPHFRAIDDEDSMEEERRLCYVGITRAEQVVYLTWAQTRMLNGMTRSMPPSRFIGEISDALKETPGFATTQTSTAGRSKAFVDEGGNGREKSSYAEQNLIESHLRGPDNLKQWGNKKYGFNDAADVTFKSGDHIKHAKWGEGKVLEAMKVAGDWILTVRFEAVGVKKLAAGIAPIEKV